MEQIVNGVIIQDNKYLAVKEAKDWYWKLPGGGIEDNETPEAALIREFEEELGITNLAIIVKLGEFQLSFKERNFCFHSYLVETDQEPQRVEDNLIFEWQSLERMLNENDQAPSQKILYKKLEGLGLT